MATYKINPYSDGSEFGIEVVNENGTHQTMLGFMMEAEAQEWIDADDAGRLAP